MSEPREPDDAFEGLLAELKIWHHDAIECVICGHRWMAVYPCCAPALECGECGHMNAKPPCGDGGV